MNKLLTAVATVLFLSALTLAQASDAALKAVIDKDRSDRSADGKLQTLSASEHLARGTVYFDNRAFPQAREHFQKILDTYPTDPTVSSALFMTGRSFYWEREYSKCIPILARVATEFPSSKDGREGLYFQASCHVRLGKNAEAAPLFERYTVMYPTGERIDGAYLNEIDALRESGQYAAADTWVERARTRFKGQPTETNAMHARLRMQMYRGLWADVVATAAVMEAQTKFAGSLTSVDEVRYLRALALAKQAKYDEARSIYSSIQQSSYFGGLAANALLTKDLSQSGNGLQLTVSGGSKPKLQDYPAPFRLEILQYAKRKRLDPRFILAIMKQESTFRPAVKSGSAARGLLQLVMDTAMKYSKKAGFGNLSADDLYNPRINIAIGCEYIAALRDEFGGLNEAIAASYNGGEDNAARWLKRSKPRDPGIFTAEVGFAETKNYVFKVMNNYRAYRQLYDEDLTQR